VEHCGGLDAVVVADLFHVVSSLFAGEFLFDEFLELWVHGRRVSIIGVFVVLCCYLVLLGKRVSMSAEKFFRVKARFFSLRFWRCLWFCMVLLGLLGGVLWCASMLVVVRFCIVCGALLCWLACALSMLQGVVGKGISGEDGINRLALSSVSVRYG